MKSIAHTARNILFIFSQKIDLKGLQEIPLTLIFT